jgi:hypothetical protein
MANQLSVANVQSILTLYSRGFSSDVQDRSIMWLVLKRLWLAGFEALIDTPADEIIYLDKSIIRSAILLKTSEAVSIALTSFLNFRKASPTGFPFQTQYQ